MDLADLQAGERVVVRSVVPGERGPSGGPAMTDVVGYVEAVETVDAGWLEVRRADDTVV